MGAADPGSIALVTTCTSCGLENTDDHDFCTECKSYLRWDEDPDEADTAVLTPDEPPDADDRHLAAPLPPTAVLAPETVAAAPAPIAFTGPDRASLTFRMPDDPEDEAAGTIEVQLAAGAQTALTAILSNQSGKVDHYDVRLEGFDDGWWSVKPSLVHLVPFGADSGTYRQDVVVSLRPPRSPAARAGRWPLQLVAHSRVEDADVAAAHVVLDVAPYEQFETRVRPERATGAREATYALPVRNHGNAPLMLTFTGEDPDDEVHFAFEPERLEVPPGGEAHATMRVSAPANTGATDVERRLTVIAHGAEQSLSGTALLVQRAPVARRRNLVPWRVAFGLVSTALLVIAAFLPWLDTARGQCTSGAADEDCLRYDVFLTRLADRPTANHEVEGFTGLVNVVASAGTGAILLAVLVLLGLRTGALAWFAGLVAVAAAIVFAALGATGAGVWMMLLAGLLAIASGILATVTARRA
jgi:hypothetical protein